MLRRVCFAIVLLACHGNSEEVSTDVCVSGRRWIGEDSRDEEMRPGSECLGCHLKKDGPPLVAAWTMYVRRDRQR